MPFTFTHELHADIHFVYIYCNESGKATLWTISSAFQIVAIHIEMRFKMYTEFWKTHSFPQGNAICLMGREGDVLSAVR